VLERRLREAVDRLNPSLPAEARDEAVRKVLRPESPSLVAENRRMHRYLRDGVEVEYRRKDGSVAGGGGHLPAGHPAHPPVRLDAHGVGEELELLPDHRLDLGLRRGRVRDRPAGELVQGADVDLDGVHDRPTMPRTGRGRQGGMGRSATGPVAILVEP